MKKRFLSILLAAVLCVSLLPAAAFARETDFFRPLPETLDFDALRVDTECFSEMETVCASVTPMLGHLENMYRLVLTFDEIVELKGEVQTQAVLAMLRNYSDPERYGTAYERTTNAANAADQLALRTLQKILLDPVCGATMQEYAGYDVTLAILTEVAQTPEQIRQAERETALVVEYQKAAAEDTSCTVSGKTWTADKAYVAYMTGNLSAEQYTDILMRIYQRRADKIGEIYLRMIRLRSEIARDSGYDDYVQYAYPLLYMRDYTPSDAAVFEAGVKENLVPLFRSLNTAYRCGCFSDGVRYGAYTEAELLDTAAPYLDEISGELTDSLVYMRECDLIDAERSATKLPVSFTAELTAYGTGYVFCSRNGGNQDLSDLVHEFGHFNAMTYGVMNGCSYDTLEVHSQGLEALLMHYADALYGDEAQSQTGYKLYNFLYVILAGCAYDELQRYVYTTPTLTVSDINRRCCEIKSQYGLPTFGPSGQDYEWIDITHNFESPVYYISYATSALVALELYLDSSTSGIAAASDKYLAFVADSAETPGFRALTQRSGLDDLFAEGAVARQAQLLSGCLDREVYRMPYKDVSRCWAKDDIALLYLLGVMNGTSAYGFSPDATLTRGMAVTVLHRVCGCPMSETDASEVFSDVARGTWYADAVGWALEAGVTNGTSETTFSPDATLTCQEFAAMMFRTLYGLGGGYVGSGAEVEAAEWAVEAMRWCADYAIFESDRGTIPADASVTRAELAAALVNLISLS